MTPILCAACQTELACQPDAIEQCFCSQLTVTPETYTYISKRYSSCLCAACIEKIDRSLKKEKARQTKPVKFELIENEHYYMEGTFYVFTEKYHLQRGYCCDNGCRHCPYREK
jgi:recombinational DNA repair protein (RecF pathway)